MTRISSQPDDDKDHLNTTLDALVTGKRAPEPGPASTNDALAATARLISGQPAGPGEFPSEDTLDSIWRNVMHTQTVPTQPSSRGFVPNRVFTSDHVRDMRGPEAATTGSWLSVAAVAVLLMGIIGGAWSLRQGNNPEEPIRLAATALDETPKAAPAGDSEWLSWVQPEECTAEPMTHEEYAGIMRQEPDISGRSYEVVGPADAETAEAAARSARAREACIVYGSVEQQRSLESPALIFFKSHGANRTIPAEEMLALDQEHSMLLAETMPAREPADHVVILHETPPDDLIAHMRAQAPLPVPATFLRLAFDPGNAMMLADGRVVLPSTILYWSGGNHDEWQQVEQWQNNDPTQLPTLAVILAEDAGTWKVDESLGFCSGGDCDVFLSSRQPVSPAVNATPVATPVATPEK